MTPHPIELPSGETIQARFTLAEHTTFKVGGFAEWFVAPQSIEDLQISYGWALENNLETTLLGAGSNLLISDQGLPGLIISTRHLKQHTFDEQTGQIIAEAGKPLPKLAKQAARKGWAGLEWAVGIPGTVGGAVVMNAGAHGGCTADNLIEAHVLNPDGSIEILPAAALAYDYRSSSLQQEGRPLIRAVLQLQPGADPAIVQATTQAHLNHRLTTQPYDWPSCGSVFRNPLPRSAGWLIEQAGLKGYQIGGAQVAKKHANFILNCGHATASDIFNLIRYVQHRVEQQWSLCLHPEVKMLGEFPQVV
jgi:UDP-N-acetylmuramate dehydrogenase